jgi:hypothetical protein
MNNRFARLSSPSFAVEIAATARLEISIQFVKSRADYLHKISTQRFREPLTRKVSGAMVIGARESL